MDTRCEYCDDLIDTLPHHCSYCGHTFCGLHRIPESHHCPNILEVREKAIAHNDSLLKSYSQKPGKKHSANSWNHKQPPTYYSPLYQDPYPNQPRKTRKLINLFNFQFSITQIVGIAFLLLIAILLAWYFVGIGLNGDGFISPTLSITRSSTTRATSFLPLQGKLVLEYSLSQNAKSVYLLTREGKKIADLTCKDKGACKIQQSVPIREYELSQADIDLSKYKTKSDSIKLCASFDSFPPAEKCKEIGLASFEFTSEETPTISSAFFDCPTDYRGVNDQCQKIQRCSDGTEFGTCSTEKPKFCEDGNLLNKASVCGCESEQVLDGESCISKYQTGPKETEFQYLLTGKKDRISFEVYSGLDQYLSDLPRSYTCYNSVCPPKREIEMREINQEQQKPELDKVVELIKQKTDNKDDQARIAISLVQQIPYDWTGLSAGSLTGRYPYEVLFDNTGVCGEKSKLLAFLLKELGYGVVLLQYGDVHMAVGIKCPAQYGYNGTQYCFVETTNGTIITDSEEQYLTIGALGSPTDTIEVSDGASFDSVSEEYSDFQEWKRVTGLGPILSQSDYAIWAQLVQKYGINIDGATN